MALAAHDPRLFSGEVSRIAQTGVSSTDPNIRPRRIEDGLMKSRAELYEYHASECVRDAAQTNDPRRREMLLKLAREWMLDIEKNLNANMRRAC